jgi:hypothetical protein
MPFEVKPPIFYPDLHQFQKMESQDILTNPKEIDKGPRKKFHLDSVEKHMQKIYRQVDIFYYDLVIISFKKLIPINECRIYVCSMVNDMWDFGKDR